VVEGRRLGRCAKEADLIRWEFEFVLERCVESMRLESGTMMGPMFDGFDGWGTFVEKTDRTGIPITIQIALESGQLGGRVVEVARVLVCIRGHRERFCGMVWYRWWRHHAWLMGWHR
jgi:hypothetical protein